MAVVMEPWLLGVIAFLWLGAAGLIVCGTREISIGIKSVKIAQVSDVTYSVKQLRAKLDDYSEKITDYKKDALKQFDLIKDSPEDLEELKQYIKKMIAAQEKISKHSKKLDDDLKLLYQIGVKKGSTGFREQTNATKSFALAAAYFAMAGIVIGFNATLIAIF